MIIKPCEGRITSPFGKDILYGKERQHYGVDIAKSGEVPILAVEDGRVTKSYSSTSYGEVIFIEHVINGKVWETVYAHLRKDSRKLVQGDRVKQGQQIGLMGSTGYSTGQHLHFELHKGRWNINKSNAVNPMLYFYENDYVGKRLECIVPKLRFYVSPSWKDKHVGGHLTKGYGFPHIIGKVMVDGYPQYKVRNSKGHIYYVTANEKYVDIK